MSDARAATDGDLEYWRDTVRSARATNTGTLLAATASMEALVARIAADAARIRELEARQVPDGWQVVPTTFLRTFDEGERLSPHYLAAAVEAAARDESNMTPPSC